MWVEFCPIIFEIYYKTFVSYQCLSWLRLLGKISSLVIALEKSGAVGCTGRGNLRSSMLLLVLNMGALWYWSLNPFTAWDPVPNLPLSLARVWGWSYRSPLLAFGTLVIWARLVIFCPGRGCSGWWLRRVMLASAVPASINYNNRSQVISYWGRASNSEFI